MFLTWKAADGLMNPIIRLRARNINNVVKIVRLVLVLISNRNTMTTSQAAPATNIVNSSFLGRYFQFYIFRK